MKLIVAEENAGLIRARIERIPHLIRWKYFAGCTFLECRNGRFAGIAGREAEERS
jgi:hypothetical protein